MLRKALITVVVGGLTLGLAACGGSSGGSSSSSSSSSSSASGAKAVKIGFSPFTLDAPALQGLSKGLTGYSKAKGYSVLTADPKNDPATQAQQLQGWITRKQVNAIWVIPTSPAALKTAIKSAQSKGIAVLASGQPSDYGYSGPAPGVSFNIFDDAGYGAKGGQLLSECAKSRLGGNAKVIVVTSPASQGAAVVKQANAMKQAIASGLPNAKIVATVDSQNDRLKAQQNVASALQAHPDANAVIGQNDEGALGGMTALKQAGKNLNQSCVVDMGGGPTALKAVKDGDLYGAVAINFQGDLTQNVDLLAKMAANPKQVGRITKPPFTITKSNAAQ